MFKGIMLKLSGVILLILFNYILFIYLFIYLFTD